MSKTTYESQTVFYYKHI